MKNVVVRSISGAVYVALIVAAILCGKITFTILMLLFGILGLLEFQSMIASRNGGQGLSVVAQVLDMMLLVSLIVGTFCFLSLVIMIPLIVAVLGLRFFVAVFDKSPNAVTNVAQSVLGVLYLAIPLGLLNLVITIPTDNTTQFVLLTFILIWLNDTGAFIFGSKFGKKKLCERLSPKKSWEGFWGGFGCCIVACIIYALCYQHNILIMALYGATVSVFATVGDLFESMLKRSAGVKDSGNIIPGHGGILDRIDSLLFVAFPAIFFGYTVLTSLPFNIQ